MHIYTTLLLIILVHYNSLLFYPVLLMYLSCIGDNGANAWVFFGMLEFHWEFMDYAIGIQNIA